MPEKRYFISGIGTGIGKTLVSAVLVQRFGYAYWKPVQTGSKLDSDQATVKMLVSNQEAVFYPETYRLDAPLSPHAAAALENVNLHIKDIQAPDHKQPMIIEGAGGLLVPLNDQELMVDLAVALGAKIILVCSNYLGSINHTLLSLEYLRLKQIPLCGLIFNGEPMKSSEDLILGYTGARLLGRIPQLKQTDKQSVADAAGQFNAGL